MLKYVYPSEHRDEVRQTAKMMRHTSAIVAVPSQADTRLSSIGVTLEYQRSRGHVPNALDCKAAAESSSDRASFPVKRERSAHVEGFYVQRDVLRATGTQRVPPVAFTSSHAFSSKFGLSESKFGLKAFS